MQTLEIAVESDRYLKSVMRKRQHSRAMRNSLRQAVVSHVVPKYRSHQALRGG